MYVHIRTCGEMHVVFNVAFTYIIHTISLKFSFLLGILHNVIMSMRLVKWNDKCGYSYVNCKRDILLTSHIQAF